MVRILWVLLMVTPPFFIANAYSQMIQIDEVPMYGDMDRLKAPDLKAGDDKFITETSEYFGSREKAAKIWIEQGFLFYNQDKLGMAMRRFNQAWLLDPSNPEIFHGFSAVLHDQGDDCGAMTMSERALNMGFDTADFLADTAMLFSLCAIKKKRQGEEASSLLKKSDSLFSSASIKRPKSLYIYDKWLRALYLREDYSSAWEKVSQMRENGGQPEEMILKALREKMPEPKR